MANIQDHARRTGGLPLGEKPFDALDGLILTQLVYMPMEGLMDDEAARPTVAQAWAFLKEHVDYEALDVFQQKRYRLFESCAGLERYAGWRMRDYVNEIDAQREMQFCACTWELPDGRRYVAFRGTDLTIAGWKEDLNMSFMTVPSQQKAAAYVERAARKAGALMLGGHSKGGNLAVYAGACAAETAQRRIERVYSFDGPGVDESTLHSEGYGRISPRIESYIPQSSVVGMLLHYHPVYTVVKSTALGILQHDAMTWQIEDGAFVTQNGLDMSGKITDEAIHAWLQGMDMERRRLLVDTLYQVVDAAQAELVTDLIDDWRESAARILEAIRELDPKVKRDVRRMIHSLFSSGASEVVRQVLPNLAELAKPLKDAAKE
ncbi:MAG: DUF2974 domain-containing protein [Clostridiales bacterium]|nr:DUF2974 domain-containing protein [Clostridiales bacterium]